MYSTLSIWVKTYFANQNARDGRFLLSNTEKLACATKSTSKLQQKFKSSSTPKINHKEHTTRKLFFGSEIQASGVTSTLMELTIRLTGCVDRSIQSFKGIQTFLSTPIHAADAPTPSVSWKRLSDNILRCVWTCSIWQNLASALGDCGESCGAVIEVAHFNQLQRFECSWGT